MSKFIVAVVMAMLCISCAEQSMRANLPADLPIPAVVKMSIDSLTEDGGGYCSAWKLIDGLVATAGHCCTDKEAVYTLGPTGIDAKLIWALDDDSGMDACILKAEMSGQAIEVAQHDPRIGESIWTYGYGRGYLGMQTGYWDGRDNDGRGIVSIVAAGGMSGSPVMNREGQAVGILVSGFRGSSTTFVTSVERIRLAVRHAQSSLMGVVSAP